MSWLRIKFKICIVIEFKTLQCTETLHSEPLQICLRQGRELKEASHKILTPVLTVINQWQSRTVYVKRVQPDLGQFMLIKRVSMTKLLSQWWGLAAKKIGEFGWHRLQSIFIQAKTISRRRGRGWESSN